MSAVDASGTKAPVVARLQRGVVVHSSGVRI